MQYSQDRTRTAGRNQESIGLGYFRLALKNPELSRVSLNELIFLAIGLMVGAVAAWLAGRPALARLHSKLENDRAVHAERLKTYADAEARFREAFASLSAQALNKNNETFLHLAETRLKQARTEAAADI